MDHEITTIGIAVTGTSAQSDGTVYVCDNSVYRILFDFDEEWAAEPVKTVRFKWGSESSTEMFEGNEIELPLISGVQRIEVSLSAGKLHTKKPAIILCRESILGGGGTPDDTQGEDPDGEVGGLTTIVVTVADKIAMSDGTTYVCDNDHNYVIRFELDAEWAHEPVKTARFRYGSKYFDKVFTGDEVYVPRISGVYRFEVGVYAGSLRASTAAVITCRRSVLGSSGIQDEPKPDVYEQIMTMLNDMFALYGPDNVAKTIRIGLQEAKESGMFDGPKGDPGYTPQKGVDYFDGKNGDPGYTPVKGKDYNDGKDGVTPDFKIGTVETLPAGSNATASVTGTKENPVLNLGIPMSANGDDSNGDMTKAVYDPQGKKQDVFAYADTKLPKSGGTITGVVKSTKHEYFNDGNWISVFRNLAVFHLNDAEAYSGAFVFKIPSSLQYVPFVMNITVSSVTAMCSATVSGYVGALGSAVSYPHAVGQFAGIYPRLRCGKDVDGNRCFVVGDVNTVWNGMLLAAVPRLSAAAWNNDLFADNAITISFVQDLSDISSMKELVVNGTTPVNPANLSDLVSIEKGGTGAETVEEARTNLEVPSVTEMNTAINSHNTSPSAHSDIRNAIPNKVSQLSNDSGYLTSIPDDYVTETELDAKGYLTQHQSLAGLATETYVDNAIAAIPPPDISSLDAAKITGVLGVEHGGTGVTSLEALAETLGIGTSGGAQTATGTYTGTGVYDRSNKNILKLPFSPKFLWIQATNNTTMVKFSQMGCYAFALNSSDYIQGGHFARTVRSGTGGGVTNDLKPYSKFMDAERTEVRWYSETSADLQMNASGITYTWLAIG